jgi:tubulinyl-Tyr carboxypeptidase
MSFKSNFEGKCYRHIVLVLRFGGLFGAIGLSRRKDLMGKPLIYNSLVDLVKEYQERYENNFHKLENINFGLSVPHLTALNRPLTWKYVCINLLDGNDHYQAIEQHQRVLTRSL